MTPPGRTSHDTDTDVDPTDTADTDEPDDQAFDEDAEVDDGLGANLGDDESLASDSLEEAAELEEAAAADEDEDEDEAAVVPPEAEFDDDGEDLVTAVAGEDEGAEEIEGVRDGEFVCRSCFMAKRETQLADPKRLLCRDCV
ncbi:MAG: hypothetical protein ACLFRD_11550 [Nitriliruptoraceae bacterium]